MKWIKHMAETRDDEKVARLISIGGHEAYGLWWMVLETIAAGMDKDSQKCSLNYPISKWAAELNLLPQNVRRQIKPLVDCGLIAATWYPMQQARSEGCSTGSSSHAVASQQASSAAAMLELSAPNLLKYRDEWSSRTQKTRESLGTKKQLHNTHTEAETDTEEKHGAGAPDALSVVPPIGEAELITATAARLCERHPKLRTCGIAEASKQLRAILAKIPKAERAAKLAEIDSIHQGWCESESWTKEAGEYAKGLANWLAPTIGRFSMQPPPRASPTATGSKSTDAVLELARKNFERTGRIFG